MRALTMLNGNLTVNDIAEPDPGPGEVVVEVLACGICGSDKSCLRHGSDFNRVSQDLMGTDIFDLNSPIVLGHEYVGRIASHGPKTRQNLPVGTRVVAMPLLLREQPAMIGFSGEAVPGGFSQKMLLTEDLLIPVPDNVPDEVAALTEPLAVALHAVNLTDFTDKDVALVVGCGPIGLAIIAILKARGFSPIVASDPSDERREMARSFGADTVVDPTKDSPYEALMQVAATDDPEKMSAGTALMPSPGLRPTVAFECTGMPGLLQQIVKGVPPATRICVAGINLSPDEIEPAQCVLKELRLMFSLYYTPEEFAETLSMLASGALQVSQMVTGHVGLDGVADAFQRLDKNPSDAKIMVNPQA